MPTWEIRSAFPTRLGFPVTRVAARLGVPGVLPPVGSFHVIVEGETLTIPAAMLAGKGLPRLRCTLR